MNITELKNLFAESFARPTVRNPVLRIPNAPVRNKSFCHRIYPINKLSDLIDVLKTIHPTEDYDNKFSVRYIVLANGKLLLAREGNPDFNIPGHKNMASSCVAAGNIYFSNDYSRITKINHQSGDFHSTPSSIVWPLIVLHHTNIELLTAFTIDISTTDQYGNFHTDTAFELKQDDLYALLPNNVSENILRENRDNSIIVNEYVDPNVRNNRNVLDPILFDDFLTFPVLPSNTSGLLEGRKRGLSDMSSAENLSFMGIFGNVLKRGSSTTSSHFTPIDAPPTSGPSSSSTS